MNLQLASLRLDPLTLSKFLRKGVIDRTVTGLKIIFTALALFFIIQLVRGVILAHLKLKTDLASLSTAGVPSTEASTRTSRPASDFAMLVRQPLISLEAAQTDASKGGPKPISTIPLGLVGTFISGNRDPYAIIEDKKKSTQEVFNIGELVFGEAKLKSIHTDFVEIERNGQVERLVLDDLTDSKPDFKGGVAAMENNLYVVDEHELDKALENLPLLLTQARAVPYFKDGVAIGLRLFAIKGDSIFEKIGLKNGDILKNVNGNSLGDLTQAMKLFETLKQERSLSLKLERNMEEKDFKYEIK